MTVPAPPPHSPPISTPRALHRVAGVGKRALGYCLASRMAALDSLDLRDSDGMVQHTHTCNNQFSQSDIT